MIDLKQIHLGLDRLGRLLMLFVSLAITALFSSPTLAHLDKDFDKNGGHYDATGNYHCHLRGCRETESRWQFRRNTLASPRDPELYYNDDDWPYWSYINGSCQTARTMVLVATSLVPVSYTNPRNCVVREGLWVDEYTGEEFTRAARLEIDHIISPVYANSSNGYQWDDQVREAFANDILNLIPVSRATYRKKRQRPIGNWQPRDEYQCEYAAMWLDVSGKYDLDLFARDQSKANTIIGECESLLGPEEIIDED